MPSVNARRGGWDHGRTLRRHHHRDRCRWRHAGAHAGAVGQEDPAPRTGELPAPRDGQLGSPERVRRRSLHLEGHVVRRRRLGVPAAGALLRGRRDQALRRRALPAAAAETSATCNTSTACRPRGRSPTTTSSRTTRRPNGSTRSTATTARTPPKGTGASSIRGRPCRTSHGSQQLFDDLQSGGYHPFHAPCGILLDEAEPATEHLHPLHVVRRLPVPGARQVRRGDDRGPPDPRPAERDAPRRTPRSRASDTDATGGTVTGVVVDATAAREEVYDADVVVVSAGAANSAKILLRSANDRHPNGLANGSDQVGRNYMFHNCKAVVAIVEGAQRDHVPEDAGDQRLLLRAPTTTSGRSATSRWSASRTPRR